MLFNFIIIVAVIGLIAWVSSPKFKGKLGEFTVKVHAKKYLSEEYIMLNDCTLPDEQTGTTQIDHILLSPYGIFIIETKNYQGWIFGGERQKHWTQKIYKKSFKFQNPLYQNYKHIKVLESVLKDVVEPEYLHSIIVFTPQSTFKTPMPANVLQGKAWTDYVKQFQQVVIPAMKLKRIKYHLEKEILEKGWKTDRLHIENLKQKQEEQN
jgi:Nuclease-related domain